VWRSIQISTEPRMKHARKRAGRRVVDVQILAVTTKRSRVDRLTLKIRPCADVLQDVRRIFVPTTAAAAASQDLSEMKQPCGRTSELQPADRPTSRTGWSVYRPHPTIITVIDQAQCCPVGCNEPCRARVVCGI